MYDAKRGHKTRTPRGWDQFKRKRLRPPKPRQRKNNANMNEYKQFDRFVADLIEKQTFQSVAQAYPHAGALWSEEMHKVPVQTLQTTRKRHPEKDQETDAAAAPLPPPPRVGPDVPVGRALLAEKYGAPHDGLLSATLQGRILTENDPSKSIFGGLVFLNTAVTINPDTGAPTLFSYTLTNTSLRDLEIKLDFSDSRGVVAVGTESGLERGSHHCIVLKAKETYLSACLKPKKKKKQFSWEADSEEDEHGDGSSRKKKSTMRLYAHVQLKFLYSREVSFQLLTEACSAVYNARGETDFEKYFHGNSNENIFEWIGRQEEAAVIDRIVPTLVLSRLMGYLRQGARAYAIRVLESFENQGITGALVMVQGLKTALKSMYGGHNQSLLVAVDAGLTMQVKDLLLSDVTTYGVQQIESVPQRRIDYQNIEPYGPRIKDSPLDIFGRDKRNYPRNPEGWPRTLPFIARMPMHGRDWQSHHSGCTALHVACKKGHLPLVKTLVQYGWRLDATSFSADTPIEMAQKSGHEKLYAYLFRQHWKRSLGDKIPISLVVQMMRECRSTQSNVLKAMEAAQEVAESMDKQGILGMNQLEGFRDATVESSLEAHTYANQVKVLAETVNGPNALEEESEEEEEEEEGEGSSEEGEEDEEDEEKEEKEGSGGGGGGRSDTTTATPKQQIEAQESKPTPTPKRTIDATNYDMLNLWHVLYAGDVDRATSAIRLGCKLQYLTNVGWQAIPSAKLFIHYGKNKSWTNGGGTSLIHALVCQEYEFPAPKAKPCLLLLLDEGYPGDLLDMYGRKAVEFAKKFGHDAMGGVLKALVRKREVKETANDGTESDDSSSGEDEEDEKRGKEEKEEEKLPAQWVNTRPATVSENALLFGMCCGVHCSSSSSSSNGTANNLNDSTAAANQLVREAVLGGKSLFTHGTGDRPVVACRKRDGEIYPVRYDINWTTRFEPSFLEKGMPELDGLGWTALHVACFAGEVEVVALLLASGWNPKTTTSRGQNAMDMARIMGHEALLYALNQVIEAVYDVMIRDTTMYYHALREFTCPKMNAYARESLNMANSAMVAAARVRVQYDELKAEEDRKKAELAAAEDKNSNRNKNKKKKKKKRSKSPKALAKKKVSQEEMELSRAKAEEEKLAAEAHRNRKTFFRGRLNFRAKPITPDILDTWACKCTTINTFNSVCCKFCHVSRQAQLDTVQTEDNVAAQFNYEEGTAVSESWGSFEPCVFTNEEEAAMKKLARERVVRNDAMKTLEKKMKTTLKYSLKKFAPLERIYADANFLAHMFAVVNDIESDMNLVCAINLWLGNTDVDLSQLNVEHAAEEDIQTGVSEEVLTRLYVLAVQAKQVEVDKNVEINEWLGESDWRPPVEEEEGEGEGKEGMEKDGEEEEEEEEEVQKDDTLSGGEI